MCSNLTLVMPLNTGFTFCDYSCKIIFLFILLIQNVGLQFSQLILLLFSSVLRGVIARTHEQLKSNYFPPFFKLIKLI